MNLAISLTTTYERWYSAYWVIMSLIGQSRRPDKIVLNISKSPYLLDSGFSAVPDLLQKCEKEGLEIRWVENIGSYRKLVPVIDLFEFYDRVITVDDDVILPVNWLEKLEKLCYEKPRVIIAGRARIISKSIVGLRKGYAVWPLVNHPGEFISGIVPTGVGTIAYPDGALYIPLLRDEKARECAPAQDDLLFRAASIINNTSIYVAPDISDGRLDMLNQKTLDQSNNVRAGTGSLTGDVLLKIRRKIAGEMSLSWTPNDIALARIESFVGQRFGRFSWV